MDPKLLVSTTSIYFVWRSVEAGEGREGTTAGGDVEGAADMIGRGGMEEDE